MSTQSRPAVQRDGVPRTGPGLEAAPRPDGRPPTRTSIPLALSAAAVAAAYFAAALGGGEILRTADPAVALWPAGGILFAILVRTDFGAWPLTVAGCAAASFAATTVLGEGALLSLGMAAINMAEVLVPAVLLRRVFDTPIALGTLGEGAGFVVAAVVLGPAAGAVLAAGLGGALEGAGLWQVWQAWFGTHAVGMIVVAPALITWTPQYLADFKAPRHALEATLFVAVLAAVTFLVFGGSVAPGVFVALLLWAAFRFGTFGCAATALAVVSFLLVSHSVGMGPISIFLSELPIENRLLFVKLAMANVVLTPMAVAIVVAERRRAAEEIRRLNEGLEDRVRERVAAYERSQEALSESEERTRRLVETMNEGLGILDVDGALTYVNDRMCDMLGCAPGALLGRRFIDLIDRDGPRPAADALAPHERRAPLRASLLRADGGPLPALISPRALMDANGRETGSFVVITDISELIEAESKARQRQSELAHVTRVSTMGEMATTLAHELNQPLTAIVNYAEGSLLRMRRASGMDTTEVAEALQRISNQAVRGSEMISHIAKFVRRSDTETEPIDVNEIIRRAIALVEPELTRRRIAMRLQLVEGPPRVTANPIQVEQVILNLVRNGIESYCEPEAENREIVVHCDRCATEDAVEIAVTDRGCGLAPADVERAFDPFFTTKPNGMGMGLSISRSIVEGYGGRLWATANPDRGMTFRCTLPSAS